MKILPKSIPKGPLLVACSGGADSMAVLAFLLAGRHDVKVAFYHHDIPEDDAPEQVVMEYCKVHKLEYHTARLVVPVTGSIENHWRKYRYEFLRSFGLPVIVAHHLDDCMETIIQSTLHGNPKIIPYHTNNVFRPFLLNRKSVFLEYCEKYGIPFVDDPLNQDMKQPRAFIRKKMIPLAEEIHAGFATTIRNKVIRQYNEFKESQKIMNAS